MSILGSSVINPYSSQYTYTGATGPTGPTGNTGPIGYGITGPTGAYVTGITIINNILTNIFNNGSTITASGIAKGPTGIGEILITVGQTAAGYTFAEAYNSNSIKVRGLQLKNNTVNSKIFFTQEPNSALITVKNIVNTGITAEAGAGKYDLAKIGDDRKYQRALNVFYDEPNRSINFIGANFVEKAINVSKNITGPYSYCLEGGTTMDCFINPYVGNSDSVSYGIPPAVFIIDGSAKELTVTITNPPQSTQFGGGFVTSFSLYVRNAKNSTPLTDKFKGNILWPDNKQPCYNVIKTDGTTESCSILINFYAVQGLWYASVVDINSSTNACTTNGLGFKATCDINSFAPPQVSKYIKSPYQTINGLNMIETGELETIEYDDILEAQAQKELYLSGTTGACCLIDGTCSIDSIENCTGYFHGPGTTCGTSNIICNLPGSCCIQYKTYNTFLYNCVQDLTCTECLGYTGMNSIDIKYNGNYTQCSSVTCSDLFQELGACCDGVGGCEYTDFTSCVGSGRFFQGIGITCANNVCNGGTGACCTQLNSCGTNIGFNECLAAGGLFLGDGTDCSDYSCPQKDTCLGYIDGVRIYPGDEYGGGIVVGKFTPGKSEILGIKEYFSPQLNTISSGNTYNLQIFKSFKDHSAYYSESTRRCTDDDSYIMISYPYDIAVESANIVNPFITDKVFSNTFKWSHGTTQTAWGPLLDDSGTYYDLQLNYDEYNYNDTHLKYSEGYFNGFTGATFSSGLTLSESLYMNSFAPCTSITKYGNDTISRVLGKSVYSLNGLWHNSWGLHNTIRIISAENCNWFEYSDPNGYFTYNNFISGSEITAARTVKLIGDDLISEAQGITSNNIALSDWYLPSHDELGFIALNCLDDESPYLTNFNTILFTKGYQPLSGVYWTSNGTFNLAKNEGIKGITVAPGSMAWAMNIDSGGNLNKFIGYKYSRTDTAKVRPVRMLRCDRYYPKTTDPDYKLWKTPTPKIDE